MNTPYNVTTDKAYTGKNIDTLLEAMSANGWTDYAFLTFNQARTSGLTVIAGEKGTICSYYGGKETKVVDGKKVTTSKFKRFVVFNLSQTKVRSDLKREAA